MSTEQTRKVLKIDCGSRRCVHSANHRRPCPDCSCEKVRSLTFESIPSLRCSLFAAFPHQFRSLHSDPCSGPGGTHGRTMICMELVLAVRRPGSRRACDADGARQVLRPLCVLVPAEGQASIASFSSHSVASSSASGRSLLFVSPPHRRALKPACPSCPTITQPPALAHVTRVNSVLRDILMVGSFSQASSESRTTFHLCICIESRNPNQQSMLYHHQYQARSRISTTRNTTTIYHAPIPSVPALSSQSHYRPCFRPTLQQSLSITPLPLFFRYFRYRSNIVIGLPVQLKQYRLPVANNQKYPTTPFYYC